MNTSIYQNIATRTAGDIYIGVVGPVRTGKSTFIKRFMETQIIPNIDNVYRRERARDELPQSGSGRTVMTAEPKFVPEEAAQIQLEGGAAFSVRLIDCVGYMVRGALGQTEDDQPRMVTTPWYDHPIPMTEAAEIGTRKVIAEHSTIGIVIRDFLSGHVAVDSVFIDFHLAQTSNLPDIGEYAVVDALNEILLAAPTPSTMLKA